MSFDPQAIKDACLAGACARAASLPEDPPKLLSALQKAAWRMGWAGVAQFSDDDIQEIAEEMPEDYDPLLDPDYVEPSTNSPGFAASLNERGRRIYEDIARNRIASWGCSRELQPLRGGIQRWSRRLHTAGTTVRLGFGKTRWEPPLTSKEQDELARFIDANREDLERHANFRYADTGGIPGICLDARRILGLSKKKSAAGGTGQNEPAEDARLIATGWTPVKSKPGNCWREFWPPGGRAGRVNIFSSSDGWKVGLAYAGGSREYWPDRFATADDARAAVASRLNLQRPQLA